MPDLNRCSICFRTEDTKQAVYKGEFNVFCPECMAKEQRLAGAQKASYERDREREDYKKDALQPWLPNGKPNTEFIRAYPERSDNFTPEELAEYG